MIPLSTDWFALSIRLLDKSIRTPAHHTWVVGDGGTNVWSRRAMLYNDHGEKVLTLLSEPKSSMLDSSLALVEIANEWLYHGIGVRGVLIKLRWCVPYVVLGVSRLDLAVDFTPNERLQRQIMGLAIGKLRVGMKQNGSGFWSVNHDDWMPEMWRDKRIQHDMNWGHKESDVKWKLYYKSKELKDAVGGVGWDKPYIVDLWRESGLDINNVWRLEVSIKRCSKLMFHDKPLGLKAWRESTLELWDSLYNSRFQVYAAGDKRKKPVPFLPHGNGGAIRCRKYEGERVCSARVSLLRRLVQSLDDDEVLLDAPTRHDVLRSIDGIVTRDGLARYFEGMVGEKYNIWVNKFKGLDESAMVVRRGWESNRITAVADDYEDTMERLAMYDKYSGEWME